MMKASFPAYVRVIAGKGIVTAIVPATAEEAAQIMNADFTEERTLLVLELLSKAQREHRNIEYIKGKKAEHEAM